MSPTSQSASHSSGTSNSIIINNNGSGTAVADNKGTINNYAYGKQEKGDRDNQHPQDRQATDCRTDVADSVKDRTTAEDPVPRFYAISDGSGSDSVQIQQILQALLASMGRRSQAEHVPRRK